MLKASQNETICRVCCVERMQMKYERMCVLWSENSSEPTRARQERVPARNAIHMYTSTPALA